MEIKNKEQSFEMVLGLVWDKTNGVSKYQLKEIPGNIPTKREMLSFIMKIYDPLGHLATYIEESKILMQDVWKTGLDWESKVPSSIKQKWRIWLDRIKNVNQLAIPTCL